MLSSRLLICVTILLLLAVAVVGHAQEFRSMEITAWSTGFESPSATTTMVNYADSCNLNCVIPEIRLRADAYYTSSIEPPGTGITPTPGYDSLADTISKAHPLGIEVHPWVVTYRIWTTTSGPGHTTPEHIWWTHGPGNTDPNQDWMMYSDTGAWDYGGVVNLDPGHPAVEDYLITVFMDIVSRYDVDGINLDYIRYPATNWGYNPVSVARFNAEYGRTGNPSSTDSTWQNWRRDQITNMVKRLYLEIKAIKPLVKLSADVWNSWSTGNASYFQDWDKWTLNHWIDFVHPMTYTSNNSTFSTWLDDAVNRQHGRHVYPLIDASNSITSNVLPQIDSVRAHSLPGLGLYAYSTISNKTSLRDALVGGPFPTQVATPDMPWLSSPTLGMLKGRILDTGGQPIYPATVTVQSRTTKNTGTGFYGFVDLNPGVYSVSVTAPGYIDNIQDATITIGQVTTLNITLATDTTPPVISNVRTFTVQATNAQILWDTNEGSTSQVEYGLTASYGNLTTENLQLVTAHTVQLVNLSPLTTYHYRAISRDGAGNAGISGDYTFTTAQSDTVADIIIDNPQATLVGSWFTGTSATDKYGTNYYYCTTASSETKSARWIPNIITAGNYDVSVWYPQGSNRTTRAPYTVYYSGGSQTVNVNQQTNGGRWNIISTDKPFDVGTGGSVKVHNGTGETSLNVMADAVKFVFKQVDTQAPSVPTNLAATPISETRVDLTWTASTDNVGVSGYKVFRDSIQIGTSATPSYSDTTCSAGTSYTYVVSAYDGVGNESATSAPASATTLDTTSPSVPTNLAATPVSGTRIDLSWTASTDNVGVAGYKVFRNTVQIGTSASASYSDTTCTPGNTYTYEVSAYDAVPNESARSAPAIGTTLDTTPPSVPTNLSATPVSGTQVDLAWTASTDNIGVTGYKIFRNGGQIATSATASYSDTACTPATSYTYEVSAYDAASNESAKSTPATAATPDTIAPSVPTSLAASPVSETQVNLTWTASTDNVGVTGYKVYRNDTQIATSATASYSDTTCSAGTSYTYKVSAYDAANNESAKSTQATATTLDTHAPSVPTGLAGVAVSGTQVNLTWTASTDNVGVTGYKLYRNGGFIGTSATASYSDTTCVPATTYSYRVSAYDAASNESVQSTQAVATTPDTIPPSAPTNLTTVVISGTQIDLDWNASTDNVGVAGYKVYRNGGYLTSAGVTSYSDTSCQPGTTYTYQVTAYDAASNESGPSNQSIASTPASTDIILDNDVASYVGLWNTGTVSTDKYGADYRYATTDLSDTRTATWTPDINVAGYYDVFCWYPQGGNRTAAAPYTVYWDGGSQLVAVNQTTGGGQWNLLVSSKRFLTGTGGYIRLANGTGEASLNVMADAVRFLMVSDDITPPSVPTGLSATATSPTTINLSWTASTDNVGVTGYKIYRNGSYAASSATTSYTDTGLSPNTTYSYRVSAYDAVGNESAQSTQATATTPAAFAEIIIDNPAATFSGTWTTSTSGTDRYGTNYRYANTAVSTNRTATWRPTIVYAGNYDTYAWWSAGTNRATNSPYTVYWNGGSQTVNMNQTINGGGWRTLLTNKSFATGTAGYIRLGNGTGATGKVVIADAVRFQQISN